MKFKSKCPVRQNGIDSWEASKKQNPYFLRGEAASGFARAAFGSPVASGLVPG
jgi:hypothetical protein